MVKVAIMDKNSYDYQCDTVADGFIRLLGHENVWLRDYSFCKDAGVWSWRFTELSKHVNSIEFKDCDLIIYPEDSSVGDWIDSDKPSVFLEGFDEDLTFDQYPVGRFFSERVNKYYKREFHKDKDYSDNPKFGSLCLAAFPEEKTEYPRELFCFLECRNDYASRNRGDAQIGNVIRRYGTFTPYNDFARPPRSEYVKNLQRTKIGVVPCGGCDCSCTYRRWETPYFGALALIEQPRTRIYQDFTEDEVVYWGSLGELEDKLKFLKNNEKELEKLRVNGYNASVNRHLTIHRAKQILDDLGVEIK